MESLGPILLAVAFAVALIVVIALSAAAARERREALAAVAQRLGWRFDPAKDRRHDDRFPQFGQFRRGHSRAAYNTMSGPLEIGGRRFRGVMGDFTYQVTNNNGKSSSTTTYRFSYLLLGLPFARVPDLRIRPEGFLDKLAGAIGFDDIDFESAEFSRRYHVSSADKRFAYDVVSPRMIEFLLETGAVAIEIERGWCCLSDGRERWQPDAFETNLRWAQRFFELWPDFLTRQLDGAAHAGAR